MNYWLKETKMSTNDDSIWLHKESKTSTSQDVRVKPIDNLSKVTENAEFQYLLDELMYYERRFREIFHQKRTTIDRIGITEDWYAIKNSIIKLIRKMNEIKGI